MTTENDNLAAKPGYVSWEEFFTRFSREGIPDDFMTEDDRNQGKNSRDPFSGPDHDACKGWWPGPSAPTGVLAGPLAGDIHALPWEVTEAIPKPGFRFMVRFVDGLTGTVDLGQLIHSPGAGVFAALADPELFAKLYVQSGVVTWPGDIDLAPDAMHRQIQQHGCWVISASQG
ncbi:DUF2442 domain-containing protein [Ralstonia solanacearum]|uniref:DUF2442 domain-containing protein n=1 Tax=Ralstonia solanacearum TaxID=305 RepID=UPI0023065769|nr:DUF2442 domain-containing protein [Ralstonia solanacearum]MDB0516274.1 DUF2442 domain-containing protein [Ralstonia solanacearum]